MPTDRWIIERRDDTGQLVFGTPQPEDTFGREAIQGITEDRMAHIVFWHCRKGPEPSLDGRHIAKWAALIHPQFIARRKTW